jgi:hypothetical protein
MIPAQYTHSGSFFELMFDEGIFQLVLNREIHGTADEAWEWLNCMMDIKTFLGRPFPLVSLVHHKIEFSSAGRAIMRLAEDEEYFVAHAICAKNIAMKAMVKFLMILVPRNLYEEDVFLQCENASLWLHSQVKESSHKAIHVGELEGLELSIKTAPIQFSA